jgi:hypothetical protein
MVGATWAVSTGIDAVELAKSGFETSRIGFMHAGLRSRDSLACDLMEAVRPKVDAFPPDFLKAEHSRRPISSKRARGFAVRCRPLTNN